MEKTSLRSPRADSIPTIVSVSCTLGLRVAILTLPVLQALLRIELHSKSCFSLIVI